MDDLVGFVSPARWVGHPVIVHAVTGSTNDDARALAANGSPAGTLVVADTQTAGRGRRGRTWHSPPGENLYLSLVLRPSGDPATVAALPLVVGLAVAECIASVVPTVSVCVKWPNDVRVDGRKLAGVLVESSITQGGIAHVIVGVGINVRGASPPEGLSQPATTVRVLHGADVSRGDVLRALTYTLEGRLDAFARDGFAGALQDAVQQRCETLGRRVAIDGTVGVARSIAADGALVIRTDDGRLVEVRAGDLTDVPMVPQSM